MKIYGTENCPMCKTLKMWLDKPLTTINAEYIHVTTDEERQELQDKYNAFGFPVVVSCYELITFNDCMAMFKANRVKKREKNNHQKT